MASQITPAFYFLFTTLLFSINFTSTIAYETYTIQLHNKMTQPVTVHCMMNGKIDLKKRTIGALIFIYTIYVKYAHEQTYILCDLWADNKTGTFDVFDYKRDEYLCAENKLCYWIIKNDGLCLYKNNNGCLVHFDWY